MTNLSFVEMASILGSIGEFLGSIAVIVTLVYLAFQIKESRRATEAAVIWEKAKALRETSLIWIMFPEGTPLLFASGTLQTQEESDAKYEEEPEQGFRYLSVNRTFVKMLEASYLTARYEQERNNIRLNIRELLIIPGFRWTWPRMNNRGQFDQNFVDICESELERTKAGQLGFDD